MKKQIGVLLGLLIAYVLMGIVWIDVADALNGHGSVVWGEFFEPLSKKMQGGGEYAYLAVFALCGGMLLHIVYLAVKLWRGQSNAAPSYMHEAPGDYKAPVRNVPHPHSVEPKQQAMAEPVVYMKYRSNGQAIQEVYRSFSEIKRRGGITFGQVGRSDIGFLDSGVAGKHAELSLLDDNRLLLTHLSSGVEGTVRVNGKNVPVGESVQLDGKSEVFMAATQIVIVVR